jgi:hypothetical protein
MSAYQQVAVERLAAKVSLNGDGAFVDPPNGYLDMAEGPVVVTRTGLGTVTFDLPVSFSEQEEQVWAQVTDAVGGSVGTQFSNGGPLPQYTTITFTVNGVNGQPADLNFIVFVERVRNADELAI